MGIDELSEKFDKLQTSTKEKGENLTDTKRPILYEQSCDDIDGFVDEIASQIENEPAGIDLTSVNILITKYETITTRMEVKTKQVQELDEQAKHLINMSPEKTPEINEKKTAVADKFKTIV